MLIQLGKLSYVKLRRQNVLLESDAQRSKPSVRTYCMLILLTLQQSDSFNLVGRIAFSY